MANFKEAFAAARKAGKAEFTWQGKRYNTKLKDETASSRPKARPSVAPTKSERPKARPVRTSDSPASRMSMSTSSLSRGSDPAGEKLVVRRAGATEDKKTNTGNVANRPSAIPAKVWSDMTVSEKRQATRTGSRNTGPGSSRSTASTKSVVKPAPSRRISLSGIREAMGWNKPAPKK